VQEAEEMFRLCRRPLIEKARYEVFHDVVLWEVDEFGGDNAGLVLAEVEFEHLSQPVALPEWVGEEVTSDQRYRNSQLVDGSMGEDRAQVVEVERDSLQPSRAQA
jgi:adenylate cyclase